LKQLSGQESSGFAWRTEGQSIHLWYWDEGSQQRPKADRQQLITDVSYWPEPLLRAPLPDGLHLVRCGSGFEAVKYSDGEQVRGRWFREVPNADAWFAFVRDCGLDGALHPQPTPVSQSQLPRPRTGWRVVSTLRPTVAPWHWLIAAAAAVLGGLAIHATVSSVRYAEAVASLTEEVAQLRKERASALTLQANIDGAAAYLKTLRTAEPAITQLELLAAFAGLSFMDDANPPVLLEWESKSDKLRVLFWLPPNAPPVAELLAQVERLAVFSDVRLMTETPAGTMGIQARVLPRPTTSGENPAAGTDTR
jgi:hypothetical protein